jgi:hypothetical protein
MKNLDRRILVLNHGKNLEDIFNIKLIEGTDNFNLEPYHEKNFTSIQTVTEGELVKMIKENYLENEPLVTIAKEVKPELFL